MSRCRATDCQRPILWVRTATGKPMPLDPDPVDDGNVIVVRGIAHVYRDAAAAREATPLYPDLPLRKSHHATCPAAADFRKRGS